MGEIDGAIRELWPLPLLVLPLQVERRVRLPRHVRRAEGGRRHQPIRVLESRARGGREEPGAAGAKFNTKTMCS